MSVEIAAASLSTFEGPFDTDAIIHPPSELQTPSQVAHSLHQARPPLCPEHLQPLHLCSVCMMSVKLAAACLSTFEGPFEAAAVIQPPAELQTPSQVCAEPFQLALDSASQDRCI